MPVLSSNGRYVAFTSNAHNIVTKDKNHASDVFVRDLVANTTTLVSIATNGKSGAGTSDQPSISADGRYVAFRSDAADLVTGDTNGQSDVFVRDLTAKVTVRVSVVTGGAQANGDSVDPRISANGTLIAFSSTATNLAAPTGVGEEVFTHNMNNGSTLLASAGAGDADCAEWGGPGSRFVAGLSPDGKHIAVTAFCNGYLYLYDRVRKTGATKLVTSTYTGSGIGGELSPASYSTDGSTIAWVFTSARRAASFSFFDTSRATVETIDPPQTGVYRNGFGISADGQRAVYVGGDGTDNSPALGPGTAGTPKAYSYDRTSGTVRYLSVPLGGANTDANDTCDSPAISADGTTAAFVCLASDIVTADGNGKADVFSRTVASAPVPDLQAKASIADASVSEPASGSKKAKLKITFDRPAQFGSELDVTFTNGTATSPSDYKGTPQLIDIPAGHTSAVVKVPINADHVAEGNETFTVTFTVAYGDVTPGSHPTAVVTIHDTP